MIYAKSVLAGLGALIVTAALVVGVVFLVPVMLERSTLPAGNSATSFAVNGPWVPLWLIVAVPLLVFAAVYFFAFRRLSRASQRRRL
jgi:hypothetical protein